ncbi:uncharacterized protein MPUT_0182 [Mycoplasma putrefaciens KS1]|uniref:ABC-type transport system involved in multi-copper enzyme maturation, permease component n=2 Tax=Mycoplasma putrefaciens TaxID=2123 RepID=A0A7U4E986_MYCPK|nr:uncharacterized protein MPUT_0182 [Mycoplasma putrefaciens KS1]
MFNYQLWKDSFKSTWSFWLIILPFVTLINLLILLLIKVEDQKNLLSVNIIKNLFFTSFGIIIICIFFIIGPNALMTKPIDLGYLSYTLSTRLSRLQIFVNKMIYFIFTITSYVLVNFLLVGLFMIIKNQPSLKDWALQCLGYWLLLMAVGAICFMFSSIFNRSTYTIFFSALIIVLFYTANVTVGLAELTETKELAFLKYLTLFTLFNHNKIETDNVMKFIYQFITLGIISVICYFISAVKFIHKDLPL